jgi:hypothetical protein
MNIWYIVIAVALFLFLFRKLIGNILVAIILVIAFSGSGSSFFNSVFWILALPFRCIGWIVRTPFDIIGQTDAWQSFIHPKDASTAWARGLVLIMVVTLVLAFLMRK